MSENRMETLVRNKFGTRYRKGRGKNGMEYKVCCPFCIKHGHTPDTKFKLWINAGRKKTYRCWRCDEKGRTSDLLGAIDDMDDVPFASQRVTYLETNVEMPGEIERLDTLPEDNPASLYLRRRGFDPVAMGAYYGLCYCSHGKVYGKHVLFDSSNTLVFPIWMGGRAVGWQARLLYNPDTASDAECEAHGWPQDEDGEYARPPKYYTSPGLDKGAVLYNFDNAATGQIVVITEGPTDVLATGPSAVGTLGKGLSDTQVSMIKSHWELAVILLDPGDADRQANDLEARLSMSMPVVKVTLAGYEDPGSAPTMAIWKQIYAAGESAGIDVFKHALSTAWRDEVLKR